MSGGQAGRASNLPALTNNDEEASLWLHAKYLRVIPTQTQQLLA